MRRILALASLFTFTQLLAIGQISGSWLIAIGSTTVSGTITQSDLGFISGSMTANSQTFGSAEQCVLSLTGSISGNSVNIGFFAGNTPEISITGEFNPAMQTMSGSFFAAPPEGGCVGNAYQAATWSASKPGSLPMITGVTSAASFSTEQVAGLGYTSIFGSDLADGIYSSPNANYGTKLGPTQIFLCPGTSQPPLPPQASTVTSTCAPARMVFASPGQVNVVLPAAGNVFGQTYYFVAMVNGEPDAAFSSGAPYAVTVSSYSPSLFTAGRDCLTNTGTAQSNCPFPLSQLTPSATQAERGVITDISGNLVWSGNRARLGQYYSAWLTGLGTTPPGTSDNHFGIQGTFLDVPAYGYPNPSYGMIDITYSGAVPQFPGLYQVNFQLPLSIGEGPDGYGAWPCGNYSWELTLDLGQGSGVTTSSTNNVKIPLLIRNGDVPCSP